MEQYDPQAIEAKWQRIWRERRAFEVPNPGVDNCLLLYRMQIKTSLLGYAYQEMWVRLPGMGEAFSKGHIRGALSVPLAEIDALLAKLPKDRELVTYCGSAT